MSKHIDRQEEILRILQENGVTSVDHLAHSLGTSQATLRRDLSYLADAGLLQRKAGKVDLLLGEGEMPLRLRAKKNLQEKQHIARAALDIIQNGETILIAGGTTTLALARLLPGQRRLTVITNALPVADVLADTAGINLVVLGGEMRPGERTMHGHLTESGAKELRADKLFYGIQAISLQYGLTHNQLQEVATDRTLANSAVQVIVLADHTKFGKVAPALVMPLSSVHTLITGCEVPEEMQAGLRAQGVQLILA
jgi:DeoR family transcriptional regulator, aga operon transcriptional repressor